MLLYFIFHLSFVLSLIKTSQSGHSNSSQIIELSHNVQILLLLSRIISQYFVHRQQIFMMFVYNVYLQTIINESCNKQAP